MSYPEVNGSRGGEILPWSLKIWLPNEVKSAIEKASKDQ